MRIPNFELFFLFHGDKFSTNFMEAFNDKPALFRAWSLQTIGIMAEQMLVDARDSAAGCNRDKCYYLAFAGAFSCNSPNKFVETIGCIRNFSYFCPRK